MPKQRKIIFVTTNNLTTNPRLYKEVLLARENGFECKVILFDLANWSKPFENNLRSNLAGIAFKSIPAGRESFLPWFISTASEKICKVLCKIGLKNNLLTSIAVSRRCLLLLYYLSKEKPKYDFIIAHNIGALYPCLKYSRKNNVPIGFDIEDYYPGEIQNIDLRKHINHLLSTIFPQLSYISQASPLYVDRLRKDFSIVGVPVLTVLNSFPSHEFVKPLGSISEKIKLVWFSQNISSGRGLEPFLKCFPDLSETVELHLIGNPVMDFYNEFIKGRAGVYQHNAMPQHQLHESLKDFDIGLAIEVGQLDENKDLCVSNKIIAYAQAGLFILATDTAGQRFIINQLDSGGRLIEELEVRRFLENLPVIIDSIRAGRATRYSNNSKFSWENASVALLEAWSGN